MKITRRKPKVILLPKSRPVPVPVYPSDGGALLENLHAWLELEKISAIISARKGLDADDIRQTAALRIWKKRPKIANELSWRGYCAKTVSNVCASEFRSRYARPVVQTEPEPSGFNLTGEARASLDQWRRRHAEKRQKRKLAGYEAKLRILAEGDVLPSKEAVRILRLLLNLENPDLFLSKAGRKKKDKIRQTEIAKSLGIKPYTVSRSLDSIQRHAEGIEVDV